MKSIRSKILVAMVTTVSLCMLAGGFVSIYFTYTSTNSVVNQSLQVMAQMAAENVSKNLERYKSIAQEVGSIARLSNADILTGEKEDIIKQRVKTYGFQAGGIIDANGVGMFDHKTYSTQDYYKSAMQGETVVTEPIVDEKTGDLTIVVATPLWQNGIPNSQPVGVVYFIPQQNFLNDIVSSIKISENGGAYVINNKGAVIAHQNITLVQQKSNSLEQVKTDPSVAKLAAIVEKMTKGESGVGRYQFNGADRMLAYAPLPDTDGWSVGVYCGSADFMGMTYIGMGVAVVSTVFALIVAWVIAFRISKRIGDPIKQCAQRVELLSQGDLASPVPEVRAKDETAMLANATQNLVHGFNTMLGDIHEQLAGMAAGDFTVQSNCKEMYVGSFGAILTSIESLRYDMTETLQQIDQAADGVAGGAEQLSSGAQVLSQGATEQASSVEELAATITEISAQVRETAAHAEDAHKKVNQTSSEVDNCNAQMEQMVSAMQMIDETSAEIGKIIKTIEDIAFQTNILALNAAVEAARAGAAGKGFAVVADEVRNLAAKSAEASKNTANLIESSTGAVAMGMQLADDTANSLKKVVESTNSVIDVVGKISAAAQSEAGAIGQVTQGIDQISGVVQTNSATAQQSAASSEELSSQALMLKEQVGRFTLPSGDRGDDLPAKEEAQQ